MDINEIIQSCPNEIDLTNEKHSNLINEIVSKIFEQGYNIKDLENIENLLQNKNDNSLIFILLSIKIAKSKMLVHENKEPIFVSIIFAMYKEHNRIKKNTEHPHGEDFLLKKIEQLEWLFEGQANIEWELVAVDDGCPENSGKIAQSIIDANNLNKKARVLYLSEAISENYPPAQGLISTKDSQKGGSIIYGMWDSIMQKKANNQIVVYTDADLSTHLGQLMLLLEPILKEDKLAAIGSRREKKSVVIKKGARNDRGKLFIYLWKRLIPNIGEIIDTQCGFKAFNANIVQEIISDMIEKKFAFDVELLLKTELYREKSISKVPIAWIDSEAASTTTDIQPYLPMLQSIAKMSKKYFSKKESSNEFIKFIETLDEDKFETILQNIPEEIVSKEPDKFTIYDDVKVKDFEAILT